MDIAFDAMGGDNAPHETVKGCIQAINNQAIKSTSNLLVVGDNDKINAELAKYQYDKNRITVVHAPEVIGFDEPPTAAIRQKKNSSIVVGLNLLKENRAGAFVSAGSTGALLTGATLIVGRVKGVERPALGTMLPGRNGYTFLIDSGANTDSKPSYLAQFGKIGSVYMENVAGIKNPKVGLINIGTEKEKGNSLTKEAYPLLENSGINFVGNIEARDISENVVDVAVCDGFIGNVILKYSEGMSKSLLSLIKETLLSSVSGKIGALFAKHSFKALKKKFDPSEIGGAPFLGLNALVVKAHGSSKAYAVENALKQCSIFIDKDISGKIKQKF